MDTEAPATIDEVCDMLLAIIQESVITSNNIEFFDKTYQLNAELGLDSLDAVDVMAAVENQTGITIDDTEAGTIYNIFADGTVEQLAEYLLPLINKGRSNA